LKFSPGPRLAATFVVFAALFIVAELSFLCPSALVKSLPQVKNTPNVRIQMHPVHSLVGDVLNNELANLGSPWNRAHNTQLTEEVRSNLSAIVAPAPDFVLILIIFAFLAMSVHYRRQLRESQARLAAVLESTGEKGAEEAFHTSEARFRTLVENSANALILFDLEGRILTQRGHRVFRHGAEHLGGTWRSRQNAGATQQLQNGKGVTCEVQNEIRRHSRG
jgi:hypothetical protein